MSCSVSLIAGNRQQVLRQLTGALGGVTLGWASGVEVICPDLVSGSEVKYLLSRTGKATLARNVSELVRQISVMLAIGHNGPLRFSP
jgi:hypothetical protein